MLYRKDYLFLFLLVLEEEVFEEARFAAVEDFGFVTEDGFEDEGRVLLAAGSLGALYVMSS